VSKVADQNKKGDYQAPQKNNPEDRGPGEKVRAALCCGEVKRGKPEMLDNHKPDFQGEGGTKSVLPQEGVLKGRGRLTVRRLPQAPKWGPPPSLTNGKRGQGQREDEGEWGSQKGNFLYRKVVVEGRVSKKTREGGIWRSVGDGGHLKTSDPSINRKIEIKKLSVEGREGDGERSLCETVSAFWGMGVIDYNNNK